MQRRSGWLLRFKVLRSSSLRCQHRERRFIVDCLWSGIWIRNLHISHNALYLPSKFCLSISVFNFSWDGCNTQEKSKTASGYAFFCGGGGGWGKEQPRCIMGDVQMVSSLVPRRTLLKSSRLNVEGLVSSPEPLGLISNGVSRPRDQKKRSPNYKSIYDFRPPKTTTDDCKRFSPSRTLSESSPQGIKGHHDPRTVNDVNENITYKLTLVALFSKFISIIPTHLVM